jgi:integrase
MRSTGSPGASLVSVPRNLTRVGNYDDPHETSGHQDLLTLAIDRRKGEPFLFAAFQAEREIASYKINTSNCALTYIASATAKGLNLTTVSKQFREARREAGLPESLVLYCARHTFGTAAYESAGNLAMVMKVMGHTDVRTAMRYQHPGLETIREAIDQRSRHNSRHNEGMVQ